MNEKTKRILPKYRITKIHIDELKGLKNLDIDVDKNLVAIMGTNGCGKSTILHALACAYAPYENPEDYKFSFFFTPNPDSDWSKSKLTLTFYDERTNKEITREYKKNSDRWSPRYKNRPKRDTYYIGISACVPEIEIEKQTSYIKYSTAKDTDRDSEKIVKDAAFILNKSYDELTMHQTERKILMGVHTNDDLTYSSLSMGAGEQRIIKILRIVYEANQYSLILIDEIDLLLHVVALERFIEVLSRIANKKHLQIFFTTHSLIMEKLSEYVDIRYLYPLPERVLVYTSINDEIIYSLSGVSSKALKIYVEDTLAETIIKRIADDLNILSKTEIIQYGSANNAFVLASSYILRKENTSNALIVLDGDVYTKEEEKRRQMGKIFSGTEADHEDKINKAVSMITELNLPSNYKPEKFIHDLLVSIGDNKEIISMAKELYAVKESHEWIDRLVKRMGHNEEYILHQIIEIVSESNEWAHYVDNVRQWMLKKKDELNYV